MEISSSEELPTHTHECTWHRVLCTQWCSHISDISRRKAFADEVAEEPSKMQPRFIVVYRELGSADNPTMIPRFFIVQCCRLLLIILLLYESRRRKSRITRRLRSCTVHGQSPTTSVYNIITTLHTRHYHNPIARYDDGRLHF